MQQLGEYYRKKVVLKQRIHGAVKKQARLKNLVEDCFEWSVLKFKIDYSSFFFIIRIRLILDFLTQLPIGMSVSQFTNHN